MLCACTKTVTFCLVRQHSAVMEIAESAPSLATFGCNGNSRECAWLPCHGYIWHSTLLLVINLYNLGKKIFELTMLSRKIVICKQILQTTNLVFFSFCNSVHDSFSNINTAFKIVLFYSIRKSSDLIIFLQKPGGFQWSTLAWGNLEPSYACVNFFPAYY